MGKRKNIYIGKKKHQIYFPDNYWLDEKLEEYRANHLNPSLSALIEDLLIRYFKESDVRKYRAQKPELITGPIPPMDRYCKDQMNGWSLEKTYEEKEVSDKQVTDMFVSSHAYMEDVKSNEKIVSAVIKTMKEGNISQEEEIIV